METNQVKQVVHMPVRHPVSGTIYHRLTTYIDRLVSQDQADKLTRHFDRKAADRE